MVQQLTKEIIKITEKKMNSDAKIKLSMAQKKEKFNKFHYGLNSPTKNEIYR